MRKITLIDNEKINIRDCLQRIIETLTIDGKMPGNMILLNAIFGDLYGSNLIEIFVKYPTGNFDKNELTRLIVNIFVSLATSNHSYKIIEENKNFIIRKEETFIDVDIARHNLFVLSFFGEFIETDSLLKSVANYIKDNKTIEDDDFIINLVKECKNRNKKCNLDYTIYLYLKYKNELVSMFNNSKEVDTSLMFKDKDVLRFLLAENKKCFKELEENILQNKH